MLKDLDKIGAVSVMPNFAGTYTVSFCTADLRWYIRNASPPLVFATKVELRGFLRGFGHILEPHDPDCLTTLIVQRNNSIIFVDRVRAAQIGIAETTPEYLEHWLDK
jgi:hypothetical protein